MIVAVIAMREFYVMYRVPVQLYVPGLIIGSMLLYLSCRYPDYVLQGIFISFFVLLIMRLFMMRTPSGSMSEIGPLGVGFFYIAGLLSFQWLLRKEPYGVNYVLLLYFSVWLADSTAYYIGKYLGSHKLYPSISPKKTVEGALGSLAGGAGGAVFAKSILDIPEISFGSAVVTGCVLGGSTLLGDLIESMFKRDAGVKDSSGIIPGHGGLLDKIDGCLVSGPVLYVIVRYF
jgi:phosphatidate cytidylyltransferase